MCMACSHTMIPSEYDDYIMPGDRMTNSNDSSVYTEEPYGFYPESRSLYNFPEVALGMIRDYVFNEINDPEFVENPPDIFPVEIIRIINADNYNYYYDCWAVDNNGRIGRLRVGWGEYGLWNRETPPDWYAKVEWVFPDETFTWET